MGFVQGNWDQIWSLGNGHELAMRHLPPLKQCFVNHQHGIYASLYVQGTPGSTGTEGPVGKKGDQVSMQNQFGRYSCHTFYYYYCPLYVDSELTIWIAGPIILNASNLKLQGI